MSNYPPQPSSPPPIPPFPQQPGYLQQPGYPQQPMGPPPPRTGTGCGGRLFIILAVVFLLLVFLCCGGVLSVWYYAKHSISTDPAVVEQTTAEITQIDIPAPLAPIGAGDFRVPVSGTVLMRGVAYADKPGQGLLLLFAAGSTLDEQTQAKLRDSIENSLRQQASNQQEQEPLQDRKESQKELTIRGAPKTQFTIVQGVRGKSRTPRIEVHGMFPGKTGPAMLILDVDAQRIPEEKVLKMLESIK